MRLLEILLPGKSESDCDKILEGFDIIDKWTIKTDGDQIILKALIEDDQSKDILLKLEEDFSGNRIVIYPVEGTLPKLDEPDTGRGDEIKLGRFITVSKEELYDDIEKPVNLSMNFLMMVILSSIVAGIGILRDNQAIIIGAMVIAPFLAPNMSMAFGTTLGDLSIIKKSAITGIIGSLIAFGISLAWGYASGNLDEIALDAQIEYEDIVLALVCGFAGVLSAVSGQGSTLVGVMVAAALLPPLMRAGLLIGGGLMSDGMNSFLIFSANIICLNIAGIITFYLAGIRPSLWYESENAMKKTKTAIIVWGAALLILIVVIWFLRSFIF